jgi:elongation factor P--(R)-beta-lysine ligase
MNLTDLLQFRERTVDAVRGFFKAEGLTEVETPTLVPSPGLEPQLDPFPVAGGAWLPTSPEYAMKKLLAAGSGSIFQICKAFRDEPPTEHHLPEFTMLEWYRVDAGYHDVMDDTERLCAAVAHAVNGETVIPWQGGQLDLTPPYERLSVREAMERHAGMCLTFGESVGEIRAAARDAGCVDISDDDTWDDVFFKAFLRHVEPRLGRGRPTLLYDYPARMAALSRIKADDPLVCERFELYAGGLELANAFGELTDPVEQRLRLEADNAERRRINKPELPIDEEFIAALEHGLPECSGCALGLDRLIMLLTNQPDIRDVIF